MLGSSTLQLFVFPAGVLYLALHVGPMLRLFYEPSIRGGTRWRFFGSEVVMFTLWLLGSPVLWGSTLGRAAMMAHLIMHVTFTAIDYFAHDFMLGSALTKREERPLLWIAKELGLLLDTATHAVAVGLVALALPPLTVAALSLPALAAYAWVTRGYLRRYGRAAATEV